MVTMNVSSFIDSFSAYCILLAIERDVNLFMAL
jgi:hypothetical protein